ncbi:MAG TPA: hypothetical protein VF173_13010, partial [Thermoanaerobaculia bacterium]|nr:hypothetical protein [Thermoanaerobaculia bacterium]
PRLVARLPAATLESEPAFRALVKKPDGKKAEAAAKKTEPATAARRPVPPGPVAKKTEAAPAEVKKPEPAPTAASAVKKPELPAAATPPPASAAKPLATAATPADTRTTKPETTPDAKPLSAAERKKMDQARQLLSQERPAKELKQAFELAREVADAHPDSKQAQHLAAEAAYRISRWSEAAAYFHRGGDPGDDQPERLFYLAVCLHESGDEAGAAAALKRALPNLRRTPYVDSYAKTILGQ